MLIGRVRDDQSPWRRSALQASSQIDCGAHQCVFGLRTPTSNHRKASADPDAHVKPRETPSFPHFLGMVLSRLDNLQPGQDCHVRIVFVCHGMPEDGFKPIARIARNPATEPGDGQSHASERGVHDRQVIFRVQLADDVRRAHHIHKQDRYLLALLFREIPRTQGGNFLLQCSDG